MTKTATIESTIEMIAEAAKEIAEGYERTRHEPLWSAKMIAEAQAKELDRSEARRRIADQDHQRQLDALHAELDLLKLELAAGDYAALKAERDCLADYLRRVLEIIDEHKGHLWPEQQATLRGARSVVR